MKKFIKKRLLESLINERLIDIDDDVDMLYNMYFKSDYDKIKKTGSLKGIEFKEAETSTDILKSPICKKADSINRCRIIINKYSNFYRPHDKTISLSVNKSAVDFIRNNGGPDEMIEIAARKLNLNHAHMLIREFNEEIMKGSINHELVHWIDDTLHNNHIDKTLKNGKINDSGNVNTHYIEIEGQIHNIKQLKRKYSDIWDILSFEEMIKLSPTLYSINNKLNNNQKLKSYWLKTLKRRMYREGLLGDNMVGN